MTDVNGDMPEPQENDAPSLSSQDESASCGRNEHGERRGEALGAVGLEDCYAVIPSGGVGSRLWPLSRGDRPKYLFDLLGQGRTLIQSTYDRVSKVVGVDHVLLVTGWRHVAPVREQLPGLAEDAIVAEPVPRDSGPAIALGAAILARRHGGGTIVASFAADQVIRGDEAFADAVRQAVAAARAGYIATIGIAASRPSTAFGYILEDSSLADAVPDAPSARLVRRFVEKPDAATAQAYLSTGRYRWNAGMFVMRADVLLDWLRESMPVLYQAVTRIAEASMGTRDSMDEAMAALWPGVEKIAFDYAVAEPLSLRGRVAMIPGDFGWDDVGDFNSVAALVPGLDGGTVKVLGDAGRVVALDSAGDVVAPAAGRTVALLGVDDLVVVDTPDALMVAPRARSQEVRRLVERLRSLGRDDLL